MFHAAKIALHTRAAQDHMSPVYSAVFVCVRVRPSASECVRVRPVRPVRLVRPVRPVRPVRLTASGASGASDRVRLRPTASIASNRVRPRPLSWAKCTRPECALYDASRFFLV